MLPYGRQSISEEDIAAVTEIMRGDWLTTGPKVKEFEAAVSAITGGHPVASCSSGTAALHTAYAALGVGPGDRVVTSPLSFIATASTASILGAEVVFADIDPATGLIDPDAASSLIDSRTRVIAAVDFAGHPADYPRLTEIAKTRGIATLADAAHSVGGELDGAPVGDLADISAFSFFPTKNFTTAEGGAVVARDPDVARRAREFRNIGLVREPERFEITDEGPWHQEVHALGLNYRLSDVACALGLSQLRRLDEFRRRRGAIKAQYDEALGGHADLKIPSQAPNARPVWHLYPLRVLGGRRRELYERLRGQGIGVQVNYMPVYWHPVYAREGYKRGSCPAAERFYEQELSLPMFPSLTSAQVDFVIDSVLEALV